mmetsp:Transcript_153655/g.492537  ORF Transcript_153655/g.492537 Transcript_153655/m.492537 type:complete len:110 (-) Transcript_153655:31-360(-)
MQGARPPSCRPMCPRRRTARRWSIRQSRSMVSWMLHLNNEAISGKSGVPLHEMSVESFQSVMAVNVVGVFLSMKYEIPAMMKAGGGSIVNCASIYGHNGGLGISDYATS